MAEEAIAVAPPEEAPGTPVTAVEEKPDIKVTVTPDERTARPELSDEEVAKLGEAAPAEDEITRYAKDAQRRIKSLSTANSEWRKRVVKANTDLATATNLAQELYRENQQLRQGQTRSETALIEQAVQRADAMLAHARGRLKAAYAANNVDEIVAAQEEVAKHVAESDRLKLLKPTGQPEPGGPPSADAAPPASAPRPAQGPRPLSDGTKAWLQKNTWFGKPGGEAMTGFAMGVHNELAAQGVAEETDPETYWSTIDKRLRETFPNRFKEPAAAAAAAEPEPQRPARPVAVIGSTRTNGQPVNGHVKSARQVTLTESQVRIARNLGLTAEQYAMQLVKEGKVN